MAAILELCCWKTDLLLRMFWQGKEFFAIQLQNPDECQAAPPCVRSAYDARQANENIQVSIYGWRPVPEAALPSGP